MKVSVYTPTKNRLEALAKAIDSVLNQTYQNVEMIVVNDGSTDGTAEYLEGRAKLDNRLKFFNKTVSEGAPIARNLAITNATGDFVTGLDDDDEFTPERIQAFVEYWELLARLGFKPSCIYAQDIFTRHGEVLFTTQKKGMVKADDLFEFNHIGNQVFAPKTHYIEAGLFNQTLPAWQDMEMFIRIVKMFGTAHLLDCATQLYDDSPKKDRISVKAESKVRNAYKQFSTIHAVNQPRNSQALMLQMFSKHYGVRPGLTDWLSFTKLGFWPKGLLKLALATFRP
ncbi:glycosyltransferase family 2 protein [Methylotenera sp.]|uniref:glycosyltransferase family 2 protein n=1 Tax=Methylotenera sp. TaxID=2051956 RepID=UPI0024874BD5|nr:glycosyltransferase family 2 protein [Methylotenera sp.]MDI1360974.1 glycosyltransferase family 2 protein [Methylotenera sp.]